MKSKILVFLAVITAAGSSWLSQVAAAGELGPGVGLTIYSQGFALVNQRRRMDFKQGINTIKLADVASGIEPETVRFQCLSDPRAVTILEQNYQFDLAGTLDLLSRYIGKDITVAIKGSGADTGTTVTGVLLAAVDNNLIIQSKATLRIINRQSVDAISLAQAAEDLVTRPTLFWLAQAEKTGPQLCQVTYTTKGITWSANYAAVLNAQENKVDLTGWVTIDNKSGTGYKDAAIKLVAGDVRRIKPPKRIYPTRMARAAAVTDADAPFEEKPFGEYHLYTLPRASTIIDNQLKQIELIPPAPAIPVKKQYIYERRSKADKVQVKFEFKNAKKNNLGVPLPAGKVRVLKKDPADEMPTLLGEDKIKHIARDEKVSLYIGDAFDIVPEHTLLDSRRTRRSIWEKHKIELRNRKNRPVVVYVDEKFPAHVNWTIETSTHDYKKRDAHTARFEVKVGPNSAATLEYAAAQTW